MITQAQVLSQITYLSGCHGSAQAACRALGIQEQYFERVRRRARYHRFQMPRAKRLALMGLVDSPNPLPRAPLRSCLMCHRPLLQPSQYQRYCQRTRCQELVCVWEEKFAASNLKRWIAGNGLLIADAAAHLFAEARP